jgi:hypothetical protein
MATETIVPSAPAAAAPSAPASAPASSPAPAAPASSAPTIPAASFESSKPTSSVDPAKYPIREDYAKALLAEKLAAIPAEREAPAVAEEVAVPDPAAQPAVDEPTKDTALAPDAVTEKPAEAATEAAKEEDFQLEPEAIVTPEVLSQMVKDNAEFGKLLEADPALKGQLYKTAREAAELKPYREIFPDVDSAKAAQAATATWNDVQNTFLASTTKEGTIATLGKIAELSYERDASGEPVLVDGQPVIGDDFYGFVDNVVNLDLEHRNSEVEARLKSNMYRSEEDRDRDQAVKAALDVLREETAATSPAKEALPESLQRKQEELDRRERELNQRMHGEKVEERRSFETGLQQEAQKRINDGILKIIANVEKQGAVVSPYLKNILPKAIGAKLLRKIQANPTLQGQMQELQRLPLGDASRQRRLVAIDRAVQQYLPDVAREELREAGVQTATSAAARRAKIDAQIDATKKTEPKGSTGPAGTGAALSAHTAFEHAQAEWQRSNPGKPFDKVAKDEIIPRVLQLMQSR